MLSVRAPSPYYFPNWETQSAKSSPDNKTYTPPHSSPRSLYNLGLQSVNDNPLTQEPEPINENSELATLNGVDDLSLYLCKRNGRIVAVEDWKEKALVCQNGGGGKDAWRAVTEASGTGCRTVTGTMLAPDCDMTNIEGAGCSIS